MDALTALFMLAAGLGEPALAGGPGDPCAPVRPRIEHRIEDHSAYDHGRRAHPCGSHRAGAVHRVEAQGGSPVQVRSRGQDVRIHAGSRAHARAVRAGDPIRLDAPFFAAPMAGGVERPAALRVYGRRGVIVIAPGSGHAPVSAGQAAAARGLPRG